MHLGAITELLVNSYPVFASYMTQVSNVFLNFIIAVGVELHSEIHRVFSLVRIGFKTVEHDFVGCSARHPRPYNKVA